MPRQCYSNFFANASKKKYLFGLATWQTWVFKPQQTFKAIHLDKKLCALTRTHPHLCLLYVLLILYSVAKKYWNIEALSLLFTANPTFLANTINDDIVRYHCEQCLNASCLHCWTNQVIKTDASNCKYRGVHQLNHRKLSLIL